MKLINLLLTSQHVYYKAFVSKGEETSVEKALNEDRGEGLFSQLEIFLSNNPPPSLARINFILDQGLISYRFFELPESRRSKVEKILQFELSNNLILENDDIHYDFTLKKLDEKKGGVGVFSISKELIERLQKISQKYKLEIGMITPLASVIDLEHQKERETFVDNHIYVHFGEHSARILVYKQGCVFGITHLETPSSTEHFFDSVEDLKSFLVRVNQVISMIVMRESEISKIIVNDEVHSLIKVNENQELYLASDFFGNEQRAFHDAVAKFIQEPISVKRGQVNLLQYENLFLQEIKKHSRVASFTAALLFSLLLIFLGKEFYQIYEESNHLEHVKKEHVAVTRKYLPATVSPNSAVSVLQREVGDLREELEVSKKYTVRGYEASTLLKQISGLKKEIPSLNFNILTYKPSNATSKLYIFAEGVVDTFEDFDRMEAILKEKIPNFAEMRTSKRSTREGKTSFSIRVEQ